MTTVKHTYAEPTNKQVAMAESLAKRAGYRFLSDAFKAMRGKSKIGNLTRGDYSALIDWLQDRR